MVDRKIIMRLEIDRPGGEVDVYTIPSGGVGLSSVLGVMTKHEDEGESGGEEEDEMGETTVKLPVQFSDKFMNVVESYLNYFARESLPLKITTPIAPSSSVNILHPRIQEWLQDFSLAELARLRQICMYFELDPLIDQVDAILAISIITNPKDVFKDLHEPNLTLASKESVTNEFPILT